MSTADESLDAALADMREQLNQTSAPESLLAAGRRAVLGRKASARRRWLPVAAAALVTVGIAAVLLQSLPRVSHDQGQPAVVEQPVRFSVRRQQLPIRVVSPYTGASFQIVDASVVTDQRGLARAVYFHVGQSNQEVP